MTRTVKPWHAPSGSAPRVKCSHAIASVRLSGVSRPCKLAVTAWVEGTPFCSRHNPERAAHVRSVAQQRTQTRMRRLSGLEGVRRALIQEVVNAHAEGYALPRGIVVALEKLREMDPGLAPA